MDLGTTNFPYSCMMPCGLEKRGLIDQTPEVDRDLSGLLPTTLAACVHGQWAVMDVAH